ncbi:MAG: phosphatidate cytidylyltransferase [Candidatus Izimaplasma sp.]|nr:phosphatidate cytidylyltransferase [Candidatus Izimaplasma bacterium]
MKPRVKTAIVLVLFFVPVFVLGGYTLDVVLGILGLIATYELFKMFKIKSNAPMIILMIEILLSGIMFFLISYHYKGLLSLEWVFYALVLVVLIGALLLVFIDKFETDDFGRFLISILYPVIGFSALSALRNLSLEVVGFLFIITSMTDMFAYYIGINFGKHRLAVKISPKKSIEGAIGGIVFAVLFGIGYIYLFDLEVVGNINLNIWISICLIIVISIFGQTGDLVASKLKRGYDIKDFSDLFPGHGGVMDRFDSAILASIILILISEVVGLL